MWKRPAVTACGRSARLAPDIWSRLRRSDLQRDGRTYYVLVDVDPNIVSHAIELTRRQALRGYDAVHLACALFVAETMPSRGLPKPILLSADHDLLEAAQNEGLVTENPNAYD
jgi:predicted nucleic acid-binding protein